MFKQIDSARVDEIISLGYPLNKEHLHQLLTWTENPEHPQIETIYAYFIHLGRNGVNNVLQVAKAANSAWRFTLIFHIIANYDDSALKICVSQLQEWAQQSDDDGCDFESLRILSAHKLLSEDEISEIVRNKLSNYNDSIDALLAEENL